jgi:hypothetical protein
VFPGEKRGIVQGNDPGNRRLGPCCGDSYLQGLEGEPTQIAIGASKPLSDALAYPRKVFQRDGSSWLRRHGRHCIQPIKQNLLLSADRSSFLPHKGLVDLAIGEESDEPSLTSLERRKLRLDPLNLVRVGFDGFLVPELLENDFWVRQDVQYGTPDLFFQIVGPYIARRACPARALVIQMATSVVRVLHTASL